MQPPRPGLALAVLALLAMAGPAAALSKPVIYYMGDAPEGPALEGHLLLPEAGVVPNSTSPQVRAVTPASAFVPVRFSTLPGMPHPERLKGYLLVGLWTGASPSVKGNVSATMYEVTASGNAVKLGYASVAVDANTSKLPAPTALVPPNPTPDPADPQGWLTSVAFYEAYQVAPVILQPPTLLKLAMVDRAVNATSTIAVDFAFEPSPGSGFPVGVGAGATVQYNFTASPSFVYLPWYEPDPVRTTTPRPTPAATTQAPSPTPSTPSDAPPTSTEGRGSPAPWLALLPALAALAFVLRRRLP